MKTSKILLRHFCVTAVMGAIGAILMYVEFAVPFMPGFIKVDFSELPALITTFALGPWYGVLVCLLKNLLHMFATNSAFVGELSNFILGAVFVGTAGVIYKYKKTRVGALVSCLIASIVMALISIPSNYYITYPFYGEAFGLPTAAIVEMYKAIFSGVDNLWQCLLIFNFPFNLLKGVANSILCFVVYKKLSPIMRGKLN